mmetsp:Transcript_30856/g.65506  ORF Transcript_30856/g.65506 Transcript_30856/m.65506 type:complete len:203 (+) Transcript_30856:223-831(+)
MPLARGVRLGHVKPGLRGPRVAPGRLGADRISVLIPATRRRSLSPAWISGSSPASRAVSRRWPSPSASPGRICSRPCSMAWSVSRGSRHRGERRPLRPSSGSVIKKRRRRVREKIKWVFEWLRWVPARIAEIFASCWSLISKDISTRTCFFAVVARSTERTKLILPATIPSVPSLAGLRRVVLDTRKSTAIRAFPAPRVVPG